MRRADGCKRSFLKLLAFSVESHLSPPIQVLFSIFFYLPVSGEASPSRAAGSYRWSMVVMSLLLVWGTCTFGRISFPPRAPAFVPGTSCWCIACIGPELLDNNLYFLEIGNSGKHMFSPKIKPKCSLNCLITIEK